MKIHEYQAKQILAKYGVPVPKGRAAISVDEAVKASEDLNTGVCVLKAQIHAGGRGKGGGVKVSKGLEAVREMPRPYSECSWSRTRQVRTGRRLSSCLLRKAWTSVKNFTVQCW